MNRRLGIFLVGCFLIGFGLLSGCGYKNAPVPPEAVVPKSIDNLHYQIDQKGVVLDWSFPVETIKGTKINEVESFELYRAEVPVEKLCGNCPIPFAGPFEVDGGVVYDGLKRRSATYSDSFLKPEHKYFFKVRSRVSWWASSDDSNIVSFVWFTPASTPENVSINAGDGQVKVSWSSVTQLIDGTPPTLPVRYQVQRSVGGKPFKNIGSPSSRNSFVDRQVALGQQYFYRVQAMLEYEGEYARGGVSDEFLAIPVDQTPPPAPQEITVARVDAGVRLFWAPLNTDDLQGYRVYRRQANESNYTLIAELEKGGRGYTDTDAGGVRYYYTVTAIDSAEPANESEHSREVTPRYN